MRGAPPLDCCSCYRCCCCETPSPHQLVVGRPRDGRWTTRATAAVAPAAVGGLADCGSALRRPGPTAHCPRGRRSATRVERSPSPGWQPAFSTWKERAEKRSVKLTGFSSRFSRRQSGKRSVYSDKSRRLFKRNHHTSFLLLSRLILAF